MKIFFVFLTAFVATVLSQAPTILDNAAGVAYEATIGSGTGPIRGNVVGTSSPDAMGVTVAVSLNGFPGFGESNYSE